MKNKMTCEKCCDCRECEECEQKRLEEEKAEKKRLAKFKKEFPSEAKELDKLRKEVEKAKTKVGILKAFSIRIKKQQFQTGNADYDSLFKAIGQLNKSIGGYYARNSCKGCGELYKKDSIQYSKDGEGSTYCDDCGKACAAWVGDPPNNVSKYDEIDKELNKVGLRR